jgi:sulfite reductase (ferredoxin)
LQLILNDYGANSQSGELFNPYYERLGKTYFYNLLKPLGEIRELTQDLMIDWGEEGQYKTLIGIGECAGQLVDMVAIVLDETREKIEKSTEAVQDQDWVNSIYYSYSAMINAGKAFLLARELPNNTHHSVISNFEEFSEELQLPLSFREMVMQINQREPEEAFAKNYLEQADAFYHQIAAIRQRELAANIQE